MTSHDLQSLSGIGPTTAQALMAAGFSDRAAIASATVDELSAVKGFAEIRASALISEAQENLEGDAAADPGGTAESTEEHSEPKAKKPKKAKKRKKLRARHADLRKRAKKAGQKSKSASSKKKRKRWAAEADRLSKKAKKAKKRLSKLS